MAEDIAQPQRQLNDLGLYSHGAEQAEALPQERGTPEQFKAVLQKRGVKPDEFKWSGYDQAMGGRKSVTKGEVAAHFRQGMPPVRETTFNAADPRSALQRYGARQIALPGGKNYREVLMHLPMKQDPYEAFRWHGHERDLQAVQTPEHVEMARRFNPYFKEATKDMSPEQGLAAARGALANPPPGPPHMSSHWDTPNVLAHLRMSDRALPGGQKALHLEELQSDWAQQGRKKGFLPTDPMEQKPMDAVPSAPYVDSTQKWVDLGLKRLLHEAARGGYHKVVVTPGQEQADRYDLSKHIDTVRYWPPDDQYPRGNLKAFHKTGGTLIDKGAQPEELADIVGKEVADRLLKVPLQRQKGPSGLRPFHHLANADLKVGGEGMKAFYDTIVPTMLQKLAQKHDPQAKVHLHGEPFGGKNGPSRRGVGHDLHSLDITPRMRESILRRGFPHFSEGGEVAAPRAVRRPLVRAPEARGPSIVERVLARTA